MTNGAVAVPHICLCIQILHSILPHFIGAGFVSPAKKVQAVRECPSSRKRRKGEEKIGKKACEATGLNETMSFGLHLDLAVITTRSYHGRIGRVPIYRVTPGFVCS
jgi:hypothetical protein